LSPISTSNHYITPGLFNPTTGWAVQDIHALSHEIAEWGDDPFVNNTVQHDHKPDSAGRTARRVLTALCCADSVRSS
jgi:hypothetical protein